MQRLGKRAFTADGRGGFSIKEVKRTNQETNFIFDEMPQNNQIHVYLGQIKFLRNLFMMTKQKVSRETFFSLFYYKQLQTYREVERVV